MTIPALHVWQAGRFAGTLRPDHDALCFSYDTGCPHPLSRSLPLQAAPLTGEPVSRFFSSLLPPGNARALCAHALQLDVHDTLGLLARMGADAPGGLALLPEGHPPSPGRLAPVTPDELATLLHQLPALPLLAGTLGISQTLSGGRPKLGLARTAEGGFALPLDGARSTHVIKPDLGPWQGAALTESFCQQLARQADLPASEAELVRIGELTCSVIPRYDISHGQPVAAETFAQALGRGDVPREAQGGPTLVDCFHLLEDVTADVRAEQQVLMDLVLFNALIGNSNADSSLFVLIHAGDGPQLAPLHGALCAPVFPHLQQRLALKVGQAGELGEVRARDVVTVLQATQLETGDLLGRAGDLAQQVRRQARTLAQEYEAHPGGRTLTAILLSTIEQNATTVMQVLRGLRGQSAA